MIKYPLLFDYEDQPYERFLLPNKFEWLDSGITTLKAALLKPQEP